MLGAGLSGKFNNRQMTNGRSILHYNLYLDSALSQIWGDGSGGSSVVNGPLILV